MRIVIKLSFMLFTIFSGIFILCNLPTKIVVLFISSYVIKDGDGFVGKKIFLKF